MSAAEPDPEPEDDTPKDPEPADESPAPGPDGVHDEPSDEVPDTLPEDWTDAPAAASEETEDADETEQAADIDALADHISDLEAKLEAAERRADELVAVSKRQAAMADTLHAENQTLRDGEIREAVAPLVRHAARIADEIAHMRESRPDDADLEHVEKKLAELLHDAGVTPVVPVTGDAFDPRNHQAAGAQPTDTESEDRCVAAVRKPGLVRDDGRLLRPAEVVVFRYTPTEGAAT